MADHDPLRSPEASGPPLSPRVIQFADDLIDISPSKLPRAGPSSSGGNHDIAEGSSGGLQPPVSILDPLSRARSPFGRTDPMVKDYGSMAREPSNTSSQAADVNETPGRQGYRAAGPGNINLPPSPYTPLASQAQRTPGDETTPAARPFRPRTGSASPSIATSAGQRGASNRKMSFKRRAQSGQQKPGLLQRASMGVFPRRKYSAAGSDAGSNWKAMRRVHTTSIHPNGQDGGNTDGTVDLDALIAGADAPSIPRLLPTSKADPYATPIPTIPFLVLCLVCFGEFSSAGVAGPFLFFMIEGFNVGGEADVGFWVGIVSASFFFAQFLTSLMWASIAEKRGRRFVLLVSLLGNAVTMMLFGTATSLSSTILIRFAQGFFNGAVGVAKGGIRDLVDDTNEGKAYAQLGFWWGLGGIIGPIIGGFCESPAKKYPALFGQNQLFITYPYLLPCMVAATFTAVGAFFALFIGRDGGPRTRAIQLPEKADVERAANQMGSFGRSAGQRISGYFGGGRSSAGASDVSLLPPLNSDQHQQGNSDGAGNSKFPRTFTQQVDYETGGPPSPAPSDDGTVITHSQANPDDSAFSRTTDLPRRQRLFSRTEERQRGILGGGSAYGYDRHMSRSSAAPVAHDRASTTSRLGSFAQNRNGRNSFSSATQYAPDFEEIGQRPGFSFAQRFLLAQDDSMFTISDLWVAAAINGDEAYEEVFEDEDEDDLDGDMDNEPFEDGSLMDESIEETEEELDDESDAPHEGSSLLQPRHLPPINFAQRKMSRAGLSDAGRSYASSRPRSYRRPSATGRVPSLYANTGIETPLLSPAVNPLSPAWDNYGGPLGSAATNAGQSQVRPEAAWDPTLAGIPESQSNRNSLSVPSAQRRRHPDGSVSPSPDRRSMVFSTVGDTAGPPVSLFALLPMAIIAHYSTLAFHSSTFDQVFMTFLVTPEPSGGLGLTASHYAELIAAMAFCQVVFQFVFYPKVGPPQGKFSHLAMLRLGTAIYLPCYTLFPLLRSLLHPETDGFVMTGMIFFASLRWLANICSFTAVSVLINAMTPAHLTPLANGLAQTASSAARFVGPILGGLIWAKGIDGGPDAHAWPFNYHLGFWFVGLVAFTGFLFTWRIK
ncbi:hypothetical protein BCV70DRAFT_202612 [Testicularia cyperi]|uniref:Major facilitator superfamily MFS-1 n=1 Tax=Testicularia cyperi TaxID=1882483 RepID=A0A317XHY8_9BASI|nr:hypothetical protein BCV70DRAFT_202612 [Testicularia cyperi]